jgi:hypothetical protein
MTRFYCTECGVAYRTLDDGAPVNIPGVCPWHRLSVWGRLGVTLRKMLEDQRS